MPKLVFSIADIRNILAEKYSKPFESVRVFENQSLSIGNSMNVEDLSDDGEIFEIDMYEEIEN